MRISYYRKWIDENIYNNYYNDVKFCDDYEALDDEPWLCYGAGIWKKYCALWLEAKIKHKNIIWKTK